MYVTRTRKRSIAALLACLTGTAAGAETPARSDVHYLVDTAETIVVARVLDGEHRARGWPFTTEARAFYLLEPIRSFKGGLAEPFWLRLGGTGDPTENAEWTQVALGSDRTYLLFIRDNDRTPMPLLGWNGVLELRDHPWIEGTTLADLDDWQVLGIGSGDPPRWIFSPYNLRDPFADDGSLAPVIVQPADDLLRHLERLIEARRQKPTFVPGRTQHSASREGTLDVMEEESRRRHVNYAHVMVQRTRQGGFLPGVQAKLDQLRRSAVELDYLLIGVFVDCEWPWTAYDGEPRPEVDFDNAYYEAHKEACASLGRNVRDDMIAAGLLNERGLRTTGADDSYFFAWLDLAAIDYLAADRRVAGFGTQGVSTPQEQYRRSPQGN